MSENRRPSGTMPLWEPPYSAWRLHCRASESQNTNCVCVCARARPDTGTHLFYHSQNLVYSSTPFIIFVNF